MRDVLVEAIEVLRTYDIYLKHVHRRVRVDIIVDTATATATLLVKNRSSKRSKCLTKYNLVRSDGYKHDIASYDILRYTPKNAVS